MPEFRVQPGSLAAGGAQLVETGGAIGAVRAAVSGASGASGAMDGAAAGSYSNMSAVWLRELASLEDQVAGIGTTTLWAAKLYQAVDEAVMPG